jgi:uncharacterized protein involved in oxidation of intracellular sulfur
VKLAMVISQTNPELVFNAFRLANFSRKEGDEVKVFLLAEGVELDGITTRNSTFGDRRRVFFRPVGRSWPAGRASSCATRKGRSCVPCPR